MELVIAIVIGVLTSCGVLLVLRAHTFAVVLGLTLLSYAVNLFIFASGGLTAGKGAVLGQTDIYADPLPQALVLTAIVIGFAMTAFLVILSIRARAELGNDHVDGDSGARATLAEGATALNQHFIILPILLPLLTGALLLLPPLQASVLKRRWFSGIALLLLLASTVFGLIQSAARGQSFYLLGNWPAPFGIVLLHDKVSALFVLLSTVLACCCWLYSLAGEDERGAYFQPLLQFLLMGIHGAFLTADLFNLFVFFEVLLISSYGLLLHGGGKARTKAALHYVLLNLLGSALFLLALALLYATLGSLNMQDMAQRIPELAPQQSLILKAAAGLLLLVFALKAAVLPLHFWLPAAYASASPVVAAMFAIMTKVGVYCVLRVFCLLFGVNAGELAGFAQDFLWLAGLGTLLLAAIGVVAAQNLKKLVAYLVLVSVGSLIAVLALGSAEALAAVLYYCLHSTLIAAAMFLLADLIAVQRGTVQDRLVAGRPLQQAWLLGILFFVSVLVVVGMPPLSGFAAKIWLLQAATELSERIALWPVLLFSSLLVLIALSRAGSTLFWRVNTQQATANQALPVQWGAVVLLLACSPLLVICGEAVMQFCLEAAMQLQQLPNVHATGGNKMTVFNKVLPTPARSILLFVVWILLNNSLAPVHLLAGAVLAVLIPLLTASFSDPQPKVRRWSLAFLYVGKVLLDIVVANLQVIKLVLGPNKQLRPGFVLVPLAITEALPLTILAGTVSLTPGTVSAEILPYQLDASSAEPRYLLLHVLDLQDEAELITSIKQRYEQPLKEIFQC